MAALFQPAIREMNANKLDACAPQSFQAYLARQPGRRRVSTAAAISIQDEESLPKDLAGAEMMVLRLGRTSASDLSTKFGLVRAKRSVRDEFFLRDKEIFPKEAVPFHPPSEDCLVPFRFLGKLVEVSALSLAVASGALSEALDLDDAPEPAIAAGGSGVYSFPVRPRADLDVVWRHDEGQVEIDGLVLAHRKKRPCLFVIEAKWGNRHNSLAKHKLVYPCLALAPAIDSREVPIIPVYLRSWRTPSSVFFRIAELELDEMKTVSSLSCTRGSLLEMPFRTLTEPPGQGSVAIEKASH